MKMDEKLIKILENILDIDPKLYFECVTLYWKTEENMKIKYEIK